MPDTSLNAGISYLRLKKNFLFLRNNYKLILCQIIY